MQPMTPSVTTGAPTDPLLAELDTITKIVAAVITGLATIIGLPIIFLTYKKTRAEIAKLELEAAALRLQSPKGELEQVGGDAGVRVLLDRSPNANVQVLADPRFLAPLLLLSDFIFAWIVLTLAGYFLGIFDLFGVRRFALPILAAILLLPIAREVIRVRAVLRPPQTTEDITTSTKQTRIAVYSSYAIAVLTAVGFGLLLLFASSDPIAHIFAWVTFGIGVLLITVAPYLKRRVDRYFQNLIKPVT